MVPQDEMHQEAGPTEDKSTNQSTGRSDNTATEPSPADERPAPFSDFDPFRTTRIDTLNSQTNEFLQGMGEKSAGLEGFNEDELRSLSSDAEERARWSEARQDAFRSILRLGAKVPARDKRIL